jgi:hypothetical protein
MHMYEDGLQRCNANYAPLTTVDFLVRESELYGDKIKKATEEAFAEGWFLTAGENISSIEIEVAIYKHPAAYGARLKQMNSIPQSIGASSPCR